MQSNIMFSVAIPAFKAEYLSECINSVLSQTYDDFEIIIVNDASPDDLDNIVNKYSDSRIRYYKNKKGFGALDVVDNWNKCLSYATGDYVICMGDDDMLEPNCLQEYKYVIDTYPETFVFHGRTALIDQNGNKISILEARDTKETVWQNLFYRLKGRFQFIGDYCFNATKLKEKGGFYNIPLAWGSDDITVSMMALEGGIVNINNVIFQYRVNPFTISNGSNWRTKIDSLSLEYDWYNNLLDQRERGEKDIYYELSKSIFKQTFLKKKIGCVTEDIYSKFSSVFFWQKNKNKYGLSTKMIIYAAIMALINKGVSGYKKSI